MESYTGETPRLPASHDHQDVASGEQGLDTITGRPQPHAGQSAFKSTSLLRDSPPSQQRCDRYIIQWQAVVGPYWTVVSKTTCGCSTCQLLSRKSTTNRPLRVGQTRASRRGVSTLDCGRRGWFRRSTSTNRRLSVPGPACPVFVPSSYPTGT